MPAATIATVTGVVCLVAGVVQVVIEERLALQEEPQIYTEGGGCHALGQIYTEEAIDPAEVLL